MPHQDSFALVGFQAGLLHCSVQFLEVLVPVLDRDGGQLGLHHEAVS